MASNKTLTNHTCSFMILIFNIPRLLICLYIIQLQLRRVNCSSQLSFSNKPQEVKHFILVHGLGHGAWCWFKLIPLLEKAGHNVTAIDLSASGINTTKIQDLWSFNDYSAPLLELMDSLQPKEKVILVGHSFGGMSLALAMDMYPEKIQVAVFVSAFLPDTAHRPSYVIESYVQQINVTLTFLDTLFYTITLRDKTPALVIQFGPAALKYNLYQLSSSEDLELGNLLIRPGSVFLYDLSVSKKFSEEGFGSVKKVYIKGQQDRTIPEQFQDWMIKNEGLKDVKEIQNADHMAMLSKPQALSKLLLEVASDLS